MPTTVVPPYQAAICIDGRPYDNPYRKAHGIGWIGKNREYEALWRRRLASRKRSLWMSRLKSLRGHTIGGFGPIEHSHAHVLVKLIAEFCPEPYQPTKAEIEWATHDDEADEGG
jgi:3-oxoacyl-(acyl-carrier-protein) synthase